MEISKQIKDYDKFREDVNKIIGHNCCDSNIESALKCTWKTDGDELLICESDDDWYEYTISSIGMKGKDLYIGSSQGFTFVSAYESDWYNTVVYILSDDLRAND